MRRFMGAAAVLVLGAFGVRGAAPPVWAADPLNVRDFGAKGDGSTIDSPAINKAIAAAPSGGTVLFPPGKYQSRSTHLKSGVTLQLDAKATIRAAGSGMDAAEPNAFSQFQDFGHSHFHNALMWGENVHDVAITGGGTIDGAGLVTGN